MNNEFSLYSQEQVINKELKITFTPKKNVTMYTYEIIKDNKLVEDYNVKGNKASDINLYDSGEYKIKVTTFVGNKKQEINSGLYKVDLEKPIIILKETANDILKIEQLKKDSSINLNDYVVVTDNYDGDITSKVTSNSNEIDLTKIGLNKLTYTVSDEAGNTATKTVTVNIVKNQADTLLIIQILLMTIFLILISLIFRYRKSLKRERRISKYSVQALKDNSISLFENVINVIKNINVRISHMISKSAFINRYSKKYEKYIVLYKGFYTTELDFVATKFLSAFIFILVAVFSKAIQYQVMGLHEIILPFIFGFFLPDILYMYKYRLYRKKLENDLLQAIIIMNNAFKSGRSITQAIALVTKELDGPIGEEFKKMSMELSFGLSVDLVFRRLSERIKLEEITYLTASLSILNKTGGNIIKVFASIEKSLFNKKKLKLELAALTGSSKIIVYVLSVVPLFFILFISLVNPTYFVPLLTTSLGLVISGLTLIMYIIYIIFVSKIMKVRM